MGDTGEKIFRIGGVHAGYKFEFRQDGVFLTVYPQTNNEILFELSDMRLRALISASRLGRSSKGISEAW